VCYQASKNKQSKNKDVFFYFHKNTKLYIFSFLENITLYFCKNYIIMKEILSKHILIEDLVEKFPFSVNYLSKKGIRCIRCGEPIWGTLEEASKEKDFNDAQIDNFVKDLNKLNVDFENKVLINIKENKL